MTTQSTAVKKPAAKKPAAKKPVAKKPIASVKVPSSMATKAAPAKKAAAKPPVKKPAVKKTTPAKVKGPAPFSILSEEIEKLAKTIIDVEGRSETLGGRITKAQKAALAKEAKRLGVKPAQLSAAIVIAYLARLG